jgi:DNA repair exonuclease SbcCD ATPase subunit
MDIDFRMEKSLKSSDITDAFDIWINVDGRWLKYEMTSGGERTRADVSLHLALVCFMSGRSNTNHETIYLDEVGAALDRNGVENFVAILHSLIEQYGFKKIFNITQNVEMKRMIDNRLSVVKTSEGSKIRKF